jgi:sulfide:quinone oxidoreductase
LTCRPVSRSRRSLLSTGVDFVIGEVDLIDGAANTVALRDGRTLTYDYLVIASGTSPRPDQTPGMLGDEWRRSIFDFYSLEGDQARAMALHKFDHGRLVVHITEMPIKCPVAPLEFTFLAEAWLREKGLRDRVNLVYVTPCREERKILVESDFLVEHVDVERKALVSYDEREVPFTSSPRCRSTWAPTSSNVPASATSATTSKLTSTHPAVQGVRQRVCRG